MTKVEEKPKIKNFTDLQAWQQARVLVKEIYSTVKSFPKDEQFGLSSQMKRATVSVPSNIAEGFKRDTMKDKVRFYVQAHGSLIELQNQIIIAHDVGLIEEDTRESLLSISNDVDRLLTGLIRASKERL